MPVSSAQTVVVGAAQGIGEAVARRFATLGPVYLADINSEKVADLAASLRAEGLEADSGPVDITDPQSVIDLVAQTPEVTKVAIVAGMFSAGPSLEVLPDQFARVLSVNTIGVYDTARNYALSMSERGGGAICAVGSIAARMPRMRQAAYSASKAAMRQALRVLGMEVLPLGVRINFVAPGPTQTAMMAELSNDHDGIQLSDGDLSTFRPRIPDGRVAEPDEIAAAMEFLLSDKASHVALHDLHVDGGETLGL